MKPSLCPSLAVLDEVRDDPTIRRLLFCGVGCAVQALRGMNGGSPEAALGLDELYVLGTHCVDNSPTPEAAKNFVTTLPGVGAARADDVVAYEFMADFRVHARLADEDGGGCLAGAPLLTAEDESTKVPGVFLVGPSVVQGDLSFCFVYKFRQRFGIVAEAICRGLGRETKTAVAGLRQANMYMADLSLSLIHISEPTRPY